MSRYCCATFDTKEGPLHGHQGKLYQPFPATGAPSRLAGKRDLVRLIRGEPRAGYAYVMRSVVLEDGELRQTGCGPNFRDGYTTLCTCKHRMRTSLSADEWQGRWVAGLTSVGCGRHRWLFYLALIKEAYESQSELWHSDALPPEVRQAKSARYSELGDLYEPKGELYSAARFDPNRYHPPGPGHSHRSNACDEGWHTDINYNGKKGLKRKAKRPPSLLVGDPQFSFLWRKPLLYADGRWRQKNYGTLGEFLEALKEAG